MRRLATCLLALALLALALGGCGGGRRASGPVTTGPAATTATAPSPSSTGPADGRLLRVYFLRDGAVAPVARRVDATAAVAHATLEQLLAGPTVEERAAGLTSDVPAETELQNLTIAGGEATVDLSGAFQHGAEATIAPRLAQVVYTLTQFPTIDRVSFTIDGAPLQAATDGAGTPLDRPATRADYEPLTPPILVESPLPGETVTAPLQVHGTANVFEATFEVEVLDASGAVAGKQTVTASSGAPERGTFAVSVPLSAKPGPLELHVFDVDQANGKRAHEVTIPLTLGG